MIFTDPSGKSFKDWWNRNIAEPFMQEVHQVFGNGFTVSFGTNTQFSSWSLVGAPNGPNGMPYGPGFGVQTNNWKSFSPVYANYQNGFFSTQSVNYESNLHGSVVQAEQNARSEYFEYNTASSRSDISLYTIGIILNGAGFVSSAGEYSNVINGEWIGINGKWNSLEWGGNQWTGARQIALSKAGYFKLASRVFFVIGTGISLYQGGDALLKGNYIGASKSGFDIGMGALATFGGPPGWVIGGGYFALDALGAFDSRPFIAAPPYNPSIYSVQDNTYVAPTVILH
ncbi:MAG: hypothetical protein PHX08_23430 [Lachnospiraceae bacterium]|nr:hypothetical protein [Lachnospiraceae bacterium]